MSVPFKSWGMTHTLVAMAILGFAWRVQDLFPVLSHVKPMMLLTAAILALLLIDRRLPDAFAAAAAKPPAICAMALWGLAVVGVPFSLLPGGSLSVALKDIGTAVLLLVAIMATTRSPRDAYRMSGAQVVGAVVYSVFVLTHYSVGADGRLGDLVYYDTNGLGLVLICTLPLAEWFAFHGANLVVRAAAGASICLFFVTLAKTGSRGAFLGLIAVIGYGIFASRSTPVRRRVTVAALFGVLLVGAAGSQYWHMMDTILHPTKDYNWSGNSETGRMDVWERGIGYMLDNPIMGVGAGAFSAAEGTISPLADRQMYAVGVKWSAAHNSFLEVGAELGFPGLLAFLALIGTGFARARKSSALGLAVGDQRAAAMGDALAASLVGFCVSGFFLSMAYSAFLFAQIGIAGGLYQTLSRRSAALVPAGPPPVPTPTWSRALSAQGFVRE